VIVVRRGPRGAKGPRPQATVNRLMCSGAIQDTLNFNEALTRPIYQKRHATKTSTVI
jgi:hypothetical protein